MTKTRDGVLPRSKIEVQMPPGAATPRSGIYKQVEPRSGKTEREPGSVMNRRLPPTSKAGQEWTLVKPSSGGRK
jgi:hypothetical protein